LEDIKKDTRIVFPKTSLIAPVLLFALFLINESKFSYYLIFFVYLFFSCYALLTFFKKKWKLPVFTVKVIVAFAGILFFWVFVTFYFRQGIVLFIPLFEISLPVLMLFSFILVEIPVFLVKKSLMNKAKKKRAKFGKLLVVGITGSYGKTSTKEFLYSLLCEKYGESRVLKTDKNINTEIGIAALVLNKLNDGHKIFICEMGAYKRGEIKKICDIVKPQIGVLTGINEQHMGTQGSQENIIKSKYELIESLPDNGIAFFNAKNKYCLDLYNKTKIKKFIYGENAKNFAEENLSGAIMVAKELGMTDEEISEAIKEIENKLPGIEIKKGIKGITIIDASYSANPTGVMAHLDYLKTFSGKKVIVMPCLIELGSASKEIHQKIGKKIAEVCDLAIITTADRFKEIKQEAREKSLLIENPKIIFEKIKSYCKENDIVLLEGRVPKELITLLIPEHN